MGLDRALELTLAAIEPLAYESVPLLELTGRVAAAGVTALADVPSTDVSLKDGYAVCSTDVVAASSSNPLRLKRIGHAAADQPFVGELLPGSAVQVLSGASIPRGADAVLAEHPLVRPSGDSSNSLSGYIEQMWYTELQITPRTTRDWNRSLHGASMDESRLEYLQLLAKQYHSIRAASTAIVESATSSVTKRRMSSAGTPITPSGNRKRARARSSRSST